LQRRRRLPLRSTSEGRIHDCAGARSADQPRTRPARDCRLARCTRHRRQSPRHRPDLIAIVRAIQAARELGSKAAFDGIREAEVVPGPKATNRQDLIDFARTGAASFGHAVGTARIGTGRDAVVDSELRVHGLRGLRVADASVMPSIISGPTNAAAFVIGGRAADLIKAAK